MCQSKVLQSTGIQSEFTDIESMKEELILVKRNKKFFEEDIRSEDVIIHMENAYSWAKRRCYAKRRKVGSVLVKGNRPISSGFNGTKSGYPNICEKDGVTLPGVIHAEKNAIFKLMEEHTDSPNNSAMFVTTAPCAFCTEDLLLAKVSAVYFTEMYRGVQGVEELIKNGISIYHVNMKKIEDFDKQTELTGDFDYQAFPKDFITTIYKSEEENNVDNKIKGIELIRDLFVNYEDGKYHTKFYDVSA